MLYQYDLRGILYVKVNRPSEFGDRESSEGHHITAFSAQAAFFTVLSFFPFLIVVLSLMRFVPVTPKDLIGLVNYYLPEQYSVSLVAVINSLYGKITTTYMSFTIITLLWSASKGILSMMTGLNTIHEIPEKRNYFVLRFISTMYIAFIAVAVLIGIIVLLFGNTLLNQTVPVLPVSVQPAYYIFADPFRHCIFYIFSGIFCIMYRFLPSEHFKARQVMPGVIFSSTG